MLITAVEIIGMSLTTDVWTSFDDPISKLFCLLFCLLFYDRMLWIHSL